MKGNTYIIIAFFIITLFNNSCSDYHWTDDYCNDCAGTRLWTDVNNDSHTCFASQEECLDWVSKHKPYDDVCLKCGDD